MGSISDYGENALVGHLCDAEYTPASTLYLALSKADPTDDASGMSEPDDTAYTRQVITFDAASSRKVVQSADCDFPQFNGDGEGGDVTHWGVFDAENGGNMLAHGGVTQPFPILESLGVTIDAGKCEIEITATSGYGFSDYLVHALLGLMFRNESFAQPDTYVALCSATVSNSDTSITEQNGTGYSRVHVNKAGEGYPAWESVSDGATRNANEIVWLSEPLSLVNSSYQWTASNSGTDEYYLEADGGGDPEIPKPGRLEEDGSEMTAGTAGSLSASEWDWNDNDSLGFSTIYVRLADDANPDSKADGHITSKNDWDEVVAMAILDAQTDGNLLAFDNDNVVNLTPEDGNVTKFSGGALGISLS